MFLFTWQLPTYGDDVFMYVAFLYQPEYQELMAAKSSGVATGGARGRIATPDSEKIANNREKEGKNQENSGKKEEKLGRKGKIRKVLSL